MNFWLYIFIALVILSLPVALAVVLRRRYVVPWIYFCVGVLTFVGAQIVHLPLNRLLESLGILSEGTTSGSALIRTAIVLGLSAGITEELARAAGYWLVPKARRFQDGVMMGLGHGGVEAMLISALSVAGISALWYAQSTETLPNLVSMEDFAQINRQLELVNSTPLTAFAPLIERVIALAFQVSMSILVLQAFVKRNALYVIAAIIYHALVDAIAFAGAQQIENIWLVEAMIALLALPAVLWAFRLRSKTQFEQPAAATPISEEMGLFQTSNRHELRYQWRSKRFFIVGAVFLIFGMTSPLIAKYTPQLLSSLEGAEQFAELIPEPSIADAMGQYLSNLSQFGFILAILLGMGAIAREKEKGTAAMILSKPMPRWAFVLSKYFSQGVVYLVGFILAAIAAYYYTIFLFDGLEVVDFLLLNGLLFLWLMVFVAVTLFGSAVGRTSAAAAGISAVGAITILLLGSIPAFGGLMPGGLVSWAGQLGVGADGPPNGGAVIMSLFLIILLLVSAIAVFEQQEL